MRATNGYWRSAYHRVAPVTAESRLSIIWFYSPPSSYVVQSLVAVVKYGESKFAPLTAGEYLNMQLARASQGSVEKVTDINILYILCTHRSNTDATMHAIVAS